LTPSETPQQLRRTVFTDPQGLYDFRDLPPGKFALTASKPGYLSLEYGQRRPYEDGTPIVLNAGQAVSSVNFTLPRGSVIAGRVTDEFGEPMPSVQVQAQRFQYSADGLRRLVTVRGTTTDDRGEFRVFGLMPGEYVVSGGINPSLETGAASPRDTTNAPRDAYPLTFYPGTPNVNEAQPITLGISEEFGLSFGLVSARLARVSGTARDSDGRPLAGQVFLLPRYQQPGSRLLGAIAPDGSFTMTGVPPGEYTLEVIRTPSVTNKSAVSEFASMPVTVAGTDISGLGVTTSRGAVIGGQVVWEGSAPKPTGARSRVLVVPIGLSSSTSVATIDPNANGQIDGDGHFRIGGVFGRVLLTTNINGWAIKSVRLDGRDVTDVPVDTSDRSTFDGLRVIMTDKSSSFAGHVTDAKGNPVNQYVVVVQTADDIEPGVANRYVRTVRPDTNGRFEFRDLRPGRYLVTAIEALEQGRQYSPDFRRELRRGAREVSLREGETLTLELSLLVGL
jgi:protocatechuate 3,4-dioxygenase beta subunit